MRQIISIFILLIAPIAGAQLSDQATLRTEAVQETITIVQQNGVVYLPIDRIVASLGGEFTRTERGFAVRLDNQRATFGPEDVEAVVGENLISLGDRPPIVIESRPFVPLRFVRDFLRPAELEPVWDPEAKTLAIQPLRREIVDVEASLTTVGPLTKIIFQLSSPSQFSIVRRNNSYVIQFRNPISTATPEVDYDNPLVSRISFGTSSAEIFLKTPQVAADSYKLESPPQVILDLTRSAEAPRQPSPEPVQRRPVDTSAIDTIVIDPGHGGKEVGATGPAGTLEKELTLQISRRIRDLLASRGLRVILTRNDDVLIDLDQRTAIANQYKADLFVSVHLNAVPFGSARGAETYFLSLEATDERARLSAERENADLAQQPRAAGSDLDMILWDLAQQRYLKESSRFAEHVQNEVAAATGIERRGVKQAPFRVLLGAMMPAILVEVGFISNPEEETMLRSADYQSQIATAIADAILSYKSEYEQRAGNLKAHDEPTQPAVSRSNLDPEAARSEP